MLGLPVIVITCDLYRSFISLDGCLHICMSLDIYAALFLHYLNVLRYTYLYTNIFTDIQNLSLPLSFEVLYKLPHPSVLYT